MRKFSIATWLPAVVVGLAWFFSERFPSTFFPPFSKTLAAVGELVGSEKLVIHVLPTLLTTILGFAIGVVLAIIVGTLVGFSSIGRFVFEPFIGFWRAAPSSALIPLVISVGGVGQSTVLWSVVIAVFLNVALLVSVSVRKADPPTVNTMRILGFGSLSTAFRARLPAALGEIITGVQSGLQIALLVTVLVEVLIGGAGMGRYLMDSLDRYLIENLWAGILILGCSSAVLNVGFRMIIDRSFGWLRQGRRL
jgi:ABC-type nitrate/sulfonate/bicarbonate transport system permease component